MSNHQHTSAQNLYKGISGARALKGGAKKVETEKPLRRFFNTRSIKLPKPAKKLIKKKKWKKKKIKTKKKEERPSQIKEARISFLKKSTSQQQQ